MDVIFKQRYRLYRKNDHKWSIFYKIYTFLVIYLKVVMFHI